MELDTCSEDHTARQDRTRSRQLVPRAAAGAAEDEAGVVSIPISR